MCSVVEDDTKTYYHSLSLCLQKLGVAQLSLLDDMGWSAGDSIAIASTDYDLRQSEQA